jgi:hypothetical protein
MCTIIYTSVEVYIYDMMYYMFCILYILYIICINILMYMSAEVHAAALRGRKRPRQDRGDARRGKSGPLCAD